MSTEKSETKRGSKSGRGTVQGHPHLTNTLKLSDQQMERLARFRKSLGKVASRSQLKKANKEMFACKASPTYITKNVAFKTNIRGIYSLVATDGANATKAAMKEYVDAKEAEAPKKAKSTEKAAKPVKKAAAAKKSAKASKPAPAPAPTPEAPAVNA